MGGKAEGVEKEEKKKKEKKVGENNGQLRFVRHHGWRTQARQDQLPTRERENHTVTFFVIVRRCKF